MREVTLIITSCDRVDLLERTFNSIILTNTYPIKKYIIIEDSGKIGINDFIKTKYPKLNIELIYNSPKLGQLKSIDKVYSMVDTEYVFHCEDDWEFYKEGYIDYSFKILDSNPKILSCWLREDNDTNGMPIEPIYQNYENVKYRLMSKNWRDVWYGFTLIPTLIRISEYNLVKPYSQYVEEHIISIKYNDLGFSVAKCDGGYVKHIGWNRHVF
jgi:hypothetical protein